MTDVAAALLFGPRGLLICRRPAGKPRGGLWEFAGGKVEPGESPAEALVRECREELGLTVHVGPLYAKTVHAYPDLTVRLFFYCCTAEPGVPRMFAHDALRFVGPDELTSFRFCPADEEIVRRIAEDFGAGRLPPAPGAPGEPMR